MWPVCSRLLKYWDFEQAQKKPTLRWGGFLYNRFDVKKERRIWGFPQTLIRVRSKLMGYQLALMFNQVEIGYQQPALLRLFKFPHWAIIHLHSDCIARRRVAVWSGGNLCVTKSHLISCRLARPMQIPNTLVFTIVHKQRHTCVHNCTQANIHRDTYYVYMHVHTDRRHRRQLKLTSCWPTPRGAVCMSVCECVPLISLNTKYACISVFVCFYILPVVQMQCSFERLYKNFAISPTFFQWNGAVLYIRKPATLWAALKWFCCSINCPMGNVNL